MEAPWGRWANAIPLWTQTAGKTFLLQRYFTAGVNGNEREMPRCYFLAEQSTTATQRLPLARQLIEAMPSEGVAAEKIAFTWNALMRYASQQAQARKKGSGRFSLILDEFPCLLIWQLNTVWVPHPFPRFLRK